MPDARMSAEVPSDTAVTPSAAGHTASEVRSPTLLQRLWRHATTFAIAFLVLYLAIYIANHLGANRERLPDTGQILRWAAILLGGFTASLIAVAILRTLWRFFTQDRGGRAYTPNTISYLQTIHAILAFLWTGVTSAIGVKAVILPEAAWVSVDSLIPILAGLLAGVTVLGFWAMFLHVIDRTEDVPGSADTRRNRFIDFVLFLLLPVPFIFVISTVTSVMGVAGDDAITAHLRQSVDVLEEDLQAVSDIRTSELELAAILRNFGEKFADNAQTEAAGGFTGVAGFGPLATWLDSRSATFLDLAGTVEDSIRRSDQEVARLNDALRDLRNAITDRSDDQSLAAFQTDFRFRYNTLRGDIVRLKTETPLPLVKTDLTGLRDLFAAGGAASRIDTSDSPASLAASQQEWAREFGLELRAQYAAALDLIDEIEASSQGRIRAFEPITLATAVIVYAGAIVPPWAIAFAVDFSLFVWVIWVWRYSSRRVFAATGTREGSRPETAEGADHPTGAGAGTPAQPAAQESLRVAGP